VDRLEGACRWFKVGLELYVAEGPGVIAELRERGLSVFLDLKLHDIPNTVAAAVKSATAHGANMLTVHAAGGPQMLTAASKAAAMDHHAPLLLAVTVLTSMDRREIVGIPSDPEEQVMRLANIAFECGITGLVSSAGEVGRLRRTLGERAVLVTPGIRMPGDPTDDQNRIVSPDAAILAGSTYLVVGRPICHADDPCAAARTILGLMSRAMFTVQNAGQSE
jgi:orotidine-5'-phosphate decarboxylase